MTKNDAWFSVAKQYGLMDFECKGVRKVTVQYGYIKILCIYSKVY